MVNFKLQSNILVWFARISGLLVSVIWLYILISGAAVETMESQMGFSLEGVLMTILVIASIVGIAIAWKYPFNGGKIIVITSVFLIIFNYFSAGNNKYIPIAVQGLPFFLVGIFFIQSHLAKENSP